MEPQWKHNFRGFKTIFHRSSFAFWRRLVFIKNTHCLCVLVQFSSVPGTGFLLVPSLTDVYRENQEMEQSSYLKHFGSYPLPFIVITKCTIELKPRRFFFLLSWNNIPILCSGSQTDRNKFKEGLKCSECDYGIVWREYWDKLTGIITFQNNHSQHVAWLQHNCDFTNAFLHSWINGCIRSRWAFCDVSLTFNTSLIRKENINTWCPSLVLRHWGGSQTGGRPLFGSTKPLNQQLWTCQR